MELRERVVGRGNVSPAVPTDRAPSLRELSDEEIKEEKLSELKFMPLMLRTASLCSILIFNLVILGLLITLIFKKEFYFSNQWGYLSIQILPPVLGTITAALWHSISINFSRITPFLLAAAPSGSTFQKTILGSYFPGLSLRNAIYTGNKLLAFIWVLQILSGTILSFKSSLLNTADYTDYVAAIVTSWALYSLISVYGLMTIFTIILIWKLHNRVTGLRWDIASIADHIVLFRNTNFLDDFEGTDTADRDSMWSRMQEMTLKLGWYYRGKDVWHGFGKVSKETDKPEKIEASSQKNSDSDRNWLRESSQNHDIDQNSQPRNEQKGSPRIALQMPATTKFTMPEVVATRYRSVSLNMETWMAYIWVGITLALLTAFLFLLAGGFVDGREVSLSYNWATLVFQFLPTFIVSLHTWFWEDVDLFARTTQPFRGMYEPNPAIENLLLDYGCLPPLVTTYVALNKKHWRIAWTSVVALLQRLLPILAAGSTTVVPGGSITVVYASMPLSICVIIWLSIYCFLIPLEIFGWQPPGRYVKRHLPRGFSSISDLISWTYASNLVRGDAGSPFDVPAKGPKSEKWYMEAQLRLKEKNLSEGRSEEDEKSIFALYSFGLYESATHKGVKCIGFDVDSNVVSIPDPKQKKSDDTETGSREPGPFDMLSPKDLKHVLSSSKERGTNLKTIEQRPPPQEEDGEAQDQA
ncbi:hypothetical protein BCR34DRAFT_159121 [Clohesyomyces aquaticus]|uniref:Phosphoribosylaminoimidazole-succinocarboxamide synthase n=1 Tax=Clohesyomyces aquaticus TaxID=1231657 RepID=A0A1Y1YJ16_9PLEO|nr:hypothetical protein BCR34DRAFT_159121 [Clohesyomyces aquaticus]